MVTKTPFSRNPSVVEWMIDCWCLKRFSLFTGRFPFVADLLRRRQPSQAESGQIQMSEDVGVGCPKWALNLRRGRMPKRRGVNTVMAFIDVARLSPVLTQKSHSTLLENGHSLYQ